MQVMFKNQRFFWVLFLLGCGDAVRVDNGERLRREIYRLFPHVRHLSTEELASRLADRDRASRLLLIDSRSAEEYAVSHLRNAVHVAPGADLAVALAGVPRGGPHHRGILFGRVPLIGDGATHATIRVFERL